MSAGYYQNGDAASLSKVSKLDDTAFSAYKEYSRFLRDKSEIWILERL